MQSPEEPAVCDNGFIIDSQKVEIRLPAIGPPRFELGQAVPKTAVLPLHHGPVAGGRNLIVAPSGMGLDGFYRASTNEPMGTRNKSGAAQPVKTGYEPRRYELERPRCRDGTPHVVQTDMPSPRLYWNVTL